MKRKESGKKVDMQKEVKSTSLERGWWEQMVKRGNYEDMQKDGQIKVV